MSMEEPHNSRYGKVMSGGQLPVTLDHSSILSLPQKSDTYVRPLATGQSQTVTVDEQQGSSTNSGKFWGARTEVQGETNRLYGK